MTFSSPVESSPGRTAARKGGARLLSRADRHLAARFSYGVTPKLAKQVRKAGGGQQWFEAQIRSAGRKDRTLKKYKKWWPSLYLSAADLWARQINGIELGGTVMRDYERWVLMRRIHSKNQLLEVMTEFWENHFNVPTVGDQHFVHRVDYGMTIRKHALDSFDTLLRKAVLHPSMLIYLNAADSTREHPNENLGRELLELHTVGVENYDEKDVVDSSRILTGWTVDTFKTWVPSYSKTDHARGKVHVKGFKARNRKANGKAVTARYLTYLAHHPDTAERVARKLVLKFVGEQPANSLVRQLARVYLDNNTEIVPVLQALIDSKQFRRSVGEKLRDPAEDVVATYRALGAKVAAPVGPEGNQTAISMILGQTSIIGQMPLAWPSPDGQPLDNASWASAGRALGSMQVHWGVANRSWPALGVQHRDPASWLPAPQASLADLVDHVARELMQRPARGSLVAACTTATGLPAEEILSAAHPKFATAMPRILVTVLDTPEFMSR